MSTAQGNLRGISDAAVSELSQIAEQVTFRAGEVVFQRGARSDHALLLLSGRLSVSVDGTGGRERNVGDIWPGELVGESVLFEPDARRLAWVRATTASTALVLPPALLEERRDSPAVQALQAHLISLLSRRIRSTDLAIRKSWQAQRKAEPRAQKTTAPQDAADAAPLTFTERLRALLGGRR